MKLTTRLGLNLYQLLRGTVVSAGSTLLNGLVAVWKLDEQSGERADSYAALGPNAPTGYPLTDNNTVTAVNRGPVGTVADFVAANNEGLSLSAFTFPSTYTISYWFQIADYTATVWQHNGGAPTLYHYPISGGGGVYVSGDNSGYVVGSDPTLSLNVWHHAVITQGATQAEVWIDGASVGTRTNAYTPAEAALWIGRDVVSSYDLNGRIDEFIIWNRVLTSDEITELYNTGVGKYYDFD